MTKNIQNYSIDHKILEENLDPSDWSEQRLLAHKMVDDMLDFLQHIGDTPVWKKTPDKQINFFSQKLPVKPQAPEIVYQEFLENVLPYRKGNVHPRFWSWVEGTGTPTGMLADMLASGMNSNVNLGDHAAMYLDRQVIQWAKQMMNFPEDSSGILLSGASMANITAIQIARNAHIGGNIRKNGIREVGKRLTVYTSQETHSCIQKAVEVAGLGSDALRKIPVDQDYRIRTDVLFKTIEKDIISGFTPLCVVANVGTVNTGSIDPLDEIRAICNNFHIWFHIDGAFGALTKLLEEFDTQLKSLEFADSIAFDFHKWMYMPYEAGCLLVRDKKAHASAFQLTPEYLFNHERGLAAGPEPVSNYGLELSRSFKALKIWMSLKEHGIDKFARMIRQNISQAAYLADLVENETELELMAPVTMNIVCFRYHPEDTSVKVLNQINREILMQLQEQGIAAPSYTILNNHYVLRVANTNQRSRMVDFDILIRETVRIGRSILKVEDKL